MYPCFMDIPFLTINLRFKKPSDVAVLPVTTPLWISVSIVYSWCFVAVSALPLMRYIGKWCLWTYRKRKIGVFPLVSLFLLYSKCISDTVLWTCVKLLILDFSAEFVEYVLGSCWNFFSGLTYLLVVYLALQILWLSMQLFKCVTVCLHPPVAEFSN